MQSKIDNQKYLTVAHNIGKHFAKEAIWHNGCCNWIGHSLEMVDNKFQIVMKSCGAERYSGLSGIAVFLTELYSQTNDKIILHTLEGTINSIIQQCKSTNNIGKFGFYTGILGIGFTLWEIGNQHNRKEWTLSGLELIRSLENTPIPEHETDVICGAAGAIPTLLKIYRKEQDPIFMQMAINCGNFLIEKAKKSQSSWCWTTVDANYGLTGYSHGSAGIALGLLELYAETHENNYLEAANFGFQYEREWFNPMEANWPDLREYSNGKTLNYGDMWCHGAPGIALSRLKAFELSGAEIFLQEANLAMNTTYSSIVKTLNNQNIRTNFSLCHGIAGNADILLTGGRTLSNPALTELAYRIGDIGIERYENTGLSWPSGINDPSGLTPGQQESPGLMLGMAGTGYFYLRLAKPEDTKSLLIG